MTLQAPNVPKPDGALLSESFGILRAENEKIQKAPGNDDPGMATSFSIQITKSTADPKEAGDGVRSAIENAAVGIRSALERIKEVNNGVCSAIERIEKDFAVLAIQLQAMVENSEGKDKAFSDNTQAPNDSSNAKLQLQGLSDNEST